MSGRQRSGGRMALEVEQLVREGAGRLLARAVEARGADASAGEVAEFLDALRADELLLVWACERADERAWEELIEQFRATVLSAARGASASESEAEELAQSVWAELYGLRERDDGTPSGKLAYYSGCGSLGGWLRAVVGQLAVDRHRRTSRLVQTEEPADFDRAAQGLHAGAEHAGWRAPAPPDPERALADAEAGRAVERALARVLSELDGEDRLLVKLYYFDGLRLKEAGAVLGVHEATASRRLTKLHAEIRRRVEAILTGEQRWTREETARTLAEAARMQTDADMRALLAAENP